MKLYIAAGVRLRPLRFFTLLAVSQLCAVAATLSVSAGSANAGTTANVNLVYASQGATVKPAALQWTVSYPAAAVVFIQTSPGTEASAAGKSITCAGGSGSYTCIAAGLLNQNTISDGPIAVLAIALSSQSSSPVTIQISSPVAADSDGNALAITGTAGVISITKPAPPPVTPPPATIPEPSLSGVACNSTSLTANASATCNVVLSGPAPAGTAIHASSSSTALTVPALIDVSEGATTASFSVTSGAITAAGSASMTLSLGSGTLDASFQLLPPANTGWFQLMNTTSGKCFADIAFSVGKSVYSVPTARTCANAPVQSLQFAATAGGYTIATNSAEYLQAGNSPEWGITPVVLAAFSGNTKQDWQLISVADGGVQIRSNLDGQCVSVSNNGMIVHESACSATGTTWKMIPAATP